VDLDEDVRILGDILNNVVYGANMRRAMLTLWPGRAASHCSETRE
jgi:hypothetical protein